MHYFQNLKNIPHRKRARLIKKELSLTKTKLWFVQFMKDLQAYFCWIDNECQIHYFWCFSIHVQVSSDFFFLNLCIFLQYLALSLCDSSIIDFHSLTWFSRFLLFMCNCSRAIFSRLISHSIVCLFFNCVIASFFHLRSWKLSSR